MPYIFKSGAWRGVSDNLFLTSAAAYKKILQMQEVFLVDASWRKKRFFDGDGQPD